MKILSFGEVLWDVFPDGEHIGGAPLNFAAHLAKMGEEVYILTSVGDDNLGEKTVNIINDFSVKCDYINVSNTLETGKCLVTLDNDKIPHYNLLNNVAYDEIKCENITDDFEVLYFGTLALRNEFNNNSLNNLINNNHFKEVFVDVNIRPPFYDTKTVDFALKNATILKISDEELPIISKFSNIDINDSFCDKLCKKYFNLKIVIITRGAKGSYCFVRENKSEYFADSVQVEVLSTVGAGDSFSAAFLHKYLNGYDVKSCLDFASKISGYVVSKTEAIPDYKVQNFE